MSEDSQGPIYDILFPRLPRGRIQVYEAGGGSNTWLCSELLARSQIIAVDADEHQIGNNAYAQTRIRDDVEKRTFPGGSFDLIVCTNVMEHLESPDVAVRNFSGCLKGGGLLLIAAPNPRSLYGLVARFTPHWFHVWFYRTLLKKPNAGRRGHEPFPVVYHPIVMPKRLIAFCTKLGLEPLRIEEYESPWNRRLADHHPLIAKFLDIAISSMNFLSLGTRNFRHSDYWAIFEKKS